MVTERRVRTVKNITNRKTALVVIPDETTTFTDPENEDQIQCSNAALTKGKTLLVIVHRLATIENADQILVVEDGKIVQTGTHSELTKEDGLYRTFVEV